MAKKIKELMQESSHGGMRYTDTEEKHYKHYAQSMKKDKMKPQSKKEFIHRTRRQDKEDKYYSNLSMD